MEPENDGLVQIIFLSFHADGCIGSQPFIFRGVWYMLELPPTQDASHLPAAHREVSELKAPRQGRVRRPQARFFPGTGAGGLVA